MWSKYQGLETKNKKKIVENENPKIKILKMQFWFIPHKPSFSWKLELIGFPKLQSDRKNIENKKSYIYENIFSKNIFRKNMFEGKYFLKIFFEMNIFKNPSIFLTFWNRKKWKIEKIWKFREKKKSDFSGFFFRQIFKKQKNIEGFKNIKYFFEKNIFFRKNIFRKNFS